MPKLLIESDRIQFHQNGWFAALYVDGELALGGEYVPGQSEAVEQAGIEVIVGDDFLLGGDSINNVANSLADIDNYRAQVIQGNLTEHQAYLRDQARELRRQATELSEEATQLDEQAEQLAVTSPEVALADKPDLTPDPELVRLSQLSVDESDASHSFS